MTKLLFSLFIATELFSSFHIVVAWLSTNNINKACIEYILVHNKNSLSKQSYCYCYGFAENYMLEGAEARLKESPTTKIFQLLRIIFWGLPIEFF